MFAIDVEGRPSHVQGRDRLVPSKGTFADEVETANGAEGMGVTFTPED